MLLATRTARSDAATLPATLSSEWIKLSSLRATPLITAVVVLIGGLTSWAVATFVTDEVLVASDVYVDFTVLTAVFAGAVAAGLEVGDASAMVATTGWALAFTVLAALLGLGVGMIVRHGAGALSGLLVWWFVAENLLAVFLPAEALRFLPFYAGTGLLGIVSDFASPEEIAIAFTRLENALVFGGYTAVALIAGAVLVQRRDAS